MLKPYLREHYQTIFVCPADDTIECARRRMPKSMKDDDLDIVTQCLDENRGDVVAYLNCFHSLWLYMKLSEPMIGLDITLKEAEAVVYF